MHAPLIAILESILFVSALSTDAFIASLAYGSNKIKIPFWSIQVIAFTCTCSLAISLFLGSFLKAYIPVNFLKFLSFLILFFIGMSKILDDFIKSIINNHTSMKKEIAFHLHDLNFILYVYANPKEADQDDSKTLSAKESFLIAIALSLDSLAAGVGAALGNMNVVVILLCSFLMSSLFIKLGSSIGNKYCEKLPIPLSGLGGVLLIALAFLRL